MGVPYGVQLTDKDAAVRARLDAAVPAEAWLPPQASAKSGFRNKAKLVATGTAAAPRLGILDPEQHPRHHDGTGHDLRDCGLYEDGMEAAFHAIAETIPAAGLEPYDVAARTGELKSVIVTLSPDRELMVRFVLRSAARLDALRAAVPGLRSALAGLGTPAAVVTANLHPEHVALPEGPDEVHLAGDPTLRMELNGIGLRLRPQGFFQTNTDVTRRLYATAAAWLAEAAAADGTPVHSAWDLYCGVGGFAFHLARPVAEGGAGVAEVWGLETSEDAVAAARDTAAELGLAGAVRFTAGDATRALSPGRREPSEALSSGKREAWDALSSGRREPSDAGAHPDDGAAPAAMPDAVVVNPPRRGIGPELAARLQDSGVPHVLYSSCNAASLAKDLAAMPAYRARRAQVFDMFPQTGHAETLVLLSRA
nr:23S rRNA (uracil(747)-C(5))-methyltransferase [Micrococcus endophyticus]